MNAVHLHHSNYSFIKKGDNFAVRITETEERTPGAIATGPLFSSLGERQSGKKLIKNADYTPASFHLFAH